MSVPYQKRLQRYIKESLNTLFKTVPFKEGVNVFSPETIVVACSDENTDLAVVSPAVTFRIPNRMRITNVIANLTTATEGNNLIVNINAGGVSIFTTNLLTVDAGEKTSITATTPPNITTRTLSENEEMTIDIDQVGSTTAGAGLKVTIVGERY